MSVVRNAGLGGALAVASMALVAPAHAEPSRVDTLVGQMTLDEKLSFLHGGFDPQHTAGAGYLPGAPRLGVPPLRLADGPAGVRTPLPATAFPAPVALTATFSPSLAREWGLAVALESRARGQDVLLAPMVNIVRVPTAGRNFETFGEDPLLASRMVSGAVEGLQGGGVIATIKHFAANNQETNRMAINVEIDERTLREIEFPAFEAAVKSGAGAVMCSYNSVNGVHACENPYLLTKVLREEWRFGGLVMSDWGATHSGIEALQAGLDLEMPMGVHMGDKLKAAVENDPNKVALVDQALRRILGRMDAVGLLAGRRTEPAFQDHPQLARRVAEASAVLLKNQDSILPLTPDRLADLVVIGATAKRPLFGGGGSAEVRPTTLDNPFDAIAGQAGRAVGFAQGVTLEGQVIPAAVVGSQGGAGWTDTTGGHVDVIDLRNDEALAAGQSREWRATLKVPEDGDYTLMLHSTAVGGFTIPEKDRGALTLELDGQVVVDGGKPFGAARQITTADGLLNQGVVVRLEAGKAYSVIVKAKARADQPLPLRLSWVTPAARRDLIAEAAAKAKTARTAVVFAFVEGTEGRDNPSLALTDHQDDLIAAVAASNPNTIVVLNTGAPVLMPWLDKVKAVLQMWYPGQAGGGATADLLTGAANPSGRLPVTYPRAETDGPTASAERFPGVDNRQAYSEGVLVGYRWYETQKVAPLFPFGHGLSYTRFDYRNLKTSISPGVIKVSFDLKNIGRRAGEEVAQVYVDAPDGKPEGLVIPAKSLVGFERIKLEPGQSRRVEVVLDQRALSYWSTASHGWRGVPGKRKVLVGGSSADIRLSADLAAKQ